MTKAGVSFSERVAAALKLAKSQRAEYEECRREDVARLVNCFHRQVVQRFNEACEASSGELRFWQGKDGSYSNDAYRLGIAHADMRSRFLFFSIIQDARVRWRLDDSADLHTGPWKWVNMSELRDADSFIQDKVLDLISRVADPV